MGSKHAGAPPLGRRGGLSGLTAPTPFRPDGPEIPLTFQLKNDKVAPIKGNDEDK